MKNFIFAIALALSATGVAQAAPLELVSDASLAAPALLPAVAELSPADLVVMQTATVVAPAANMSELPEPEVFLMMLVGLCLIGYRASRHSDEKFE